MDMPMAELLKLAKIAGVMHEADHAYSIRSSWRLHQLATDVPFIAYVINSPCTFRITWICRILFLFYNLDCRTLEF